MKYLNVFDNKSALDSSVTSINHGDGAYVFGVETDQGIQDITIYDQRHPGANCPEVYKAYPVNMKPVKLDASSTKKKPALADALYSTSDGKLTLDAQTNGVPNTAIAICVIPEVIENFENGDDSAGAVKTARFVSIDYMSPTDPTNGNSSSQEMYFGNLNVSIGCSKGATLSSSTSYVGGKWNTQKCLHACTKEKGNLANGVTNSTEDGYCAPACCCVAYSTLGTKPGDWYLPSILELDKIAENEISEKRRTFRGFTFSDGNYWSSRQDDYVKSNMYYLTISNYGNFHNFNYQTKNSNCYVVAFLALEV